MLGKKIFLCICSIFLLLGCQYKNDKKLENSEINSTLEIEKTLLNQYDEISDFLELSNGDILIHGYKKSQPVCSIYNIDNNEIIQSNSINLKKARNFKIIKDKFYLIEENKLLIFDNEFNLLKEFELPSDVNFLISNFCISNDGKNLYYVKNNDNFTKSLVEINIDTKSQRVIVNLDGNREKTLVAITQMALNDENNLIYYSGLTYEDINSQSIECYGTVNLITSEVSNYPLNLIEFKENNGFVIIADKEDPENKISPKNYILASKNDHFIKYEVKGSNNLNLCSKECFIAHDRVLNDKNVYIKHNTYIYKNNKLLKVMEEPKKFRYGNHIVDYFNSKFNIYIRSFYDVEKEKNIIEVIQIK